MRYHLGDAQLRILPLDDSRAGIYILKRENVTQPLDLHLGLEHTHTVAGLEVRETETNELCSLNDVGNKYIADMSKNYVILYEGKEVMRLQAHRLWKRVVM